MQLNFTLICKMFENIEPEPPFLLYAMYMPFTESQLASRWAGPAVWC